MCLYLIGGEGVRSADYVGNGRVTEFKYGRELAGAFRGHNDLKWLRNFGEEWGFLNRHDAIIFIDNHDSQREGSNTLTFRDAKLYKVS